MRPSKVANNNADPAPSEHQTHHETHITAGDYIKSAVYGGMDGMITSFSIALSGWGSSGGIEVIVALGLSSLIADGLSMAVADYMATKSDDEYKTAEKQRELREIDEDISAQKLEMKKLYIDLSQVQAEATEIVEILAENKKGFLDVMMVQELRLTTTSQTPFVNSVVTFFSFALFGFMPLLPFVIGKAANLGWKDMYVWISAILTAVFLFVLGFSKSMVVHSKWYYSGLEALVIGGLSAGVAYGVGIGFEKSK